MLNFQLWAIEIYDEPLKLPLRLIDILGALLNLQPWSIDIYVCMQTNINRYLKKTPQCWGVFFRVIILLGDHQFTNRFIIARIHNNVIQP
jgi:hypothetical protein